MITLINNKFEDTPKDEIGPVDLIIADPPDNIGMKYNDFIDSYSDDDYYRLLILWLDYMKKLTDGPIFLTFNQKWTKEIEHLIGILSIPLIQRLQWYFKFGQDQTSNNKYGLCYRPIYWLNSDFIIPENIKVPSARQEKYNDKRARSGGKLPSNVWEYARICGTFKERRKYCPTQLPEALVERIIRGHCRKGGRVLDPFSGSGTTSFVCSRLGVECIGIDVSETCINETTKIIKNVAQQ